MSRILLRRRYCRSYFRAIWMSSPAVQKRSLARSPLTTHAGQLRSMAMKRKSHMMVLIKIII
eukprot:scaffold2508_cov93-Skeletonema_marinoi.AAC.1